MEEIWITKGERIMGYYVAGTGVIEAKSENDIGKIKEILEKSQVFDDIDVNGLALSLGVYSRYYEDDVYGLYPMLEPYITKADIEWSGEDDNFWKHTYDEDKGWREVPGCITYDEDKAWEIYGDKTRQASEPER